MNLESLREFCLSLPGATADIKWGQDLVFSVGNKMFCAVNTEPPHQCSFKTSDDDFAELIERQGMRPAPYLARAMWVQEEQLGETLERSERERLLRQAYELVRAKLPKRLREAAAKAMRKTKTTPPDGGRRSRTVPAKARRRQR
jgi:predicted DNA-binding protein (MmcQ/YjbR family)